MACGFTASMAIFVGLLTGAANAVVVTSPSDTWSAVFAERPYVVEWEKTAAGRGGGSSGVAIDLYYCGNSCQEDDCGRWVANLCTHYLEECATTADNAQEVMMPAPLHGTSWGYKIKVTDHRSYPATGCSEEFALVASKEAPRPTEEVGGAFLKILSPVEDDLAVAGEDYTVKFTYDNFFAESEKVQCRVNLHMPREKSGECGAWVGPLCGESFFNGESSFDGMDAGLNWADATGNGVYGITIPTGTLPGYYSISISHASNHGDVFACSDEFEVVSASAATVLAR